MVTSYQVHNLILHLIRHRTRHVNLIDYWDDFQVVVNSHVKVANRLCLNALSGINNEESAFTCCNTSAHLIREIDMSRSVNKIQDILLAIKLILHLDGMTFYRDASLLLEVHVVKHLAFSYLNRVSTFQKTVGNGALTMVDVSNDAEITYMLHVLYQKNICKDTKK